MTIERVRELFADYRSALKRLKAAVEEDILLNSLAVDGTIQRFEFTFELAWKLAKNILSCNGVKAETPRAVIKEGFRAGIIKDGQGWIDIEDDRNKTSHIYDEKQALEIYNKIKDQHFDFFNKFADEAAEAIRGIEQ